MKRTVEDQRNERGSKEMKEQWEDQKERKKQWEDKIEQKEQWDNLDIILKQ